MLPQLLCGDPAPSQRSASAPKLTGRLLAPQHTCTKDQGKGPGVSSLATLMVASLWRFMAGPRDCMHATGLHEPHAQGDRHMDNTDTQIGSHTDVGEWTGRGREGGVRAHIITGSRQSGLRDKGFRGGFNFSEALGSFGRVPGCPTQPQDQGGGGRVKKCWLQRVSPGCLKCWEYLPLLKVTGKQLGHREVAQACPTSKIMGAGRQLYQRLDPAALGGCRQPRSRARLPSQGQQSTPFLSFSPLQASRHSTGSRDTGL